MKKRKPLLCIALIFSLFCLVIFPFTASAEINLAGKELTLFEDFSSYTAQDFKTIQGFGGAGSICENGTPIAPNAVRSMKLGATSNTVVPTFWAKTVIGSAKTNWSKASYMMVYLQNTAAKDYTFGFVISEFTGGDELKPEHFVPAAGMSALLEDESGKQTLIDTPDGTVYIIPAGFKGVLYIPVASGTLTNVTWQTDPWADKKVDFSHIGRVSPVLGLTSEGSSFLLGGIYTGSDNSVTSAIEALVQSAKQEEEKAESEKAESSQAEQEKQTAEDEGWIGTPEAPATENTPAESKTLGTKISVSAIVAISMGILIAVNGIAVLYYILYGKKRVKPDTPPEE